MIPCKYDDAGYFNEGLASVRRNGKEGFINESGIEVIPCKYDEVAPFDEGLARVKLNGKWGTVNKSGVETWD